MIERQIDRPIPIPPDIVVNSELNIELLRADQVSATPRRLQVGAGVGVDFHADSDLDDARCFPGHDVSPWGWMNMSRNLPIDSI
jgi:hypothetical protein